MSNSFPHLTLGSLPTPLHELPRLSKELGLDIWVKRDDLTGFAMGGNKVRETEFIFAEALEKGSDVILTAGTYQSNHARVVSAAASLFGLECHLFLSGETSSPPTGNLLLDHLAGAKIHDVSTLAERTPAMQALARELRESGRKPCVIPIGGADEVGAHGYLTGFAELHVQIAALPSKPTRIVLASSSGATYAGTMVGISQAKSTVELLGIRTDLDPDDSEEKISSIANQLSKRVRYPHTFEPEDVHLNPDYVGEGFGVPTTDGVKAIRKLWKQEGILLEPVYTAKAMAGIIDIAERGFWKNERIIFIHTGGIPTTFSFAPLLST
ncbi:MAG: D-cysteine desulfhydrase family protein [Candidatus Bathyarchaeia archaeon]